jgi:phosphoglucosamine mutase
MNINKECGSMHPEHLCAKVREYRADIGIAHDGDADRVLLCDETGKLIDGDDIMVIAALDLQAQGLLAEQTLVATVMSNAGVDAALKAAGARVVRTPVGDKNVIDEMLRHGFNLGGEQSGHLIFLDHASTGDGIVAALQVLAIMLRRGRPLSELAAQIMQRIPQILKNVTLPERRPIEQMPNLQKGIKAIEKELGRDGRVLVRWSGTEPKLRVMVEGLDEARIAAFANDLVAQAQRDVPGPAEPRA